MATDHGRAASAGYGVNWVLLTSNVAVTLWPGGLLSSGPCVTSKSASDGRTIVINQ